MSAPKGWKIFSSFVTNSPMKLLLIWVLLVSVAFNNPTDSGAVELESSTFDSVIKNTELVFINFYADWCRFSNMLAPIYNEAADTLHAEFPDRSQLILGRVDCDKHSDISSRYQVSKYPTLKLIRNGVPLKKEYRGARTAEAFVEYIKKQMQNPLHEFHSLQELMEIDSPGDKRMFIGYMTSNSTPAFPTYKKVATTLKDDCHFFIGFGDASKQMHPPDHDIIAFRPDRTRSVDTDETFSGDATNFDELLKWVQGKCVPLVREITFENAEELTEEGLPFLIFFHDPKDTESVKRFNALVANDLIVKKDSINFLTADGKKFAHPLHHLGKSEADLPLLAIDSFRHMYLFPNMKNMEVPGKVLKFISDLESGKLHREFHYGPDEPEAEDTETDAPAAPADGLPTTPPESTFQKLKPSPNRYTLLKDEL